MRDFVPLTLLSVLLLAVVACVEVEPPDPLADKVSLVVAVDLGQVEVEFEGTGAASGASIKLRIRRLVELDLSVDIPTGTTLINSNPSEQDMIVLDSPEPILLMDDAWLEVTLEAYCLEADKDNPSEGGSLSLGGPPNDDVLAVLEAAKQVPEAQGNVVVIQGAVWAVTDDKSQAELDRIGYELSSDDVETARAIIETAGLDPSRYRLFAGV